MIKPIMAEIIAATKTAPAAISFALPALSLNSGEHMSTRYSMEVLINSAVITSPIANISKHHSIRLTFKINPKTTTIIAATKCI